MYLCVLCGSENKQQLFHYTTLTDWFLYRRRSVYCAVRIESLYIVQINHNLQRDVYVEATRNELSVGAVTNILCDGQFTSSTISNVNAALPARTTPIAISEHLQPLHTATVVMKSKQLLQCRRQYFKRRSHWRS